MLDNLTFCRLPVPTLQCRPTAFRPALMGVLDKNYTQPTRRPVPANLISISSDRHSVSLPSPSVPAEFPVHNNRTRRSRVVSVRSYQKLNTLKYTHRPIFPKDNIGLRTCTLGATICVRAKNSFHHHSIPACITYRNATRTMSTGNKHWKFDEVWKSVLGMLISTDRHMQACRQRRLNR